MSFDGLASILASCRTRKADERKQLKLRLTTNITKQAKARERGAIPAFRQRNYDYAKCGMVKMWPGCGYDLESKREATLIKRFVR